MQIHSVNLRSNLPEQRPDRFAIGEKVDARVTMVDKVGRRVNVSIKAKEFEEEKQAMQEYGSSDSGASLGDILGAALQSKREEEETGSNGNSDT